MLGKNDLRDNIKGRAKQVMDIGVISHRTIEQLFLFLGMEKGNVSQQ